MPQAFSLIFHLMKLSEFVLIFFLMDKTLSIVNTVNLTAIIFASFSLMLLKEIIFSSMGNSLTRLMV